jgi:uncharacterized protein (TIGR02246 family)
MLFNYWQSNKQTYEVNMTSSTEIHEAIVAADETFMTTFSRGDTAGMATLYTESGQLMPPNSDFVTGKQALQATFQAFMDMGIKAIKLETIEAEGYGDTASEVGRYTLEDEGGQVLDQGKYIVIWKQEAGQWKMHRDIFNSSLPAPE